MLARRTASRPLPRTSPMIIRTPYGRVERLVQVAADVGGGAGRDVPAGDGELTDLRADRAQHRLLGDGGQPGQLGETLVLALPDHRHRDRARRGQHHADRLGRRPAALNPSGRVSLRR